jgi:hypothetical protein
VNAAETRPASIRLILAAALATALLATGCSRGNGDAEAEVNASRSEVNIPIPTEPGKPAITDAPNASADNIVVPADTLSEEAQMMEDAEATGMTSRVQAGTEQAEAPASDAAQDSTAQ